ncbi:hypothetical protein psyc5s11_54950 [Clostridium gelidum]|uniref:Major tropism determinant N-terminal domain-containing protein n=1 Tax=Clostridium gelidum TaxID=704125 RepID=A0ABM7TCA1_9CLOT|nr:hypothetical protein [Clostridium gelidum]BCZ49428.1 hypothetical protein psyc5s11_54950 [Clostridium gelidum]
MSNKIQFKRGIKANLPVLDAGEPAFTTDTKEFFVGDGVGNIEFAKQSDLEITNTQLSDIVKEVSSIDGRKISDGTLNFNSLDTETKDLIDKIQAERITGGTFGGEVKAKTNTDYTVAQVRNIILSPNIADVSKMNNGDVWIKYE